MKGEDDSTGGRAAASRGLLGVPLPMVTSWNVMEPLKALNAVCPYYTMFPLGFPLRTLTGRARSGDWVADPFCGRGTTNFAARLLGLPSIGVDSSPVAVALTKAKLADARAGDVVRIAACILGEMPKNVETPSGEFWALAYHSNVLKSVCWLRGELLRDCRSDSRILLRAILLGALHGPLTKSVPSHLSNQCPRTYGPKPDYAVKFWRKRRMKPPNVDLLAVVRVRAKRYLTNRPKFTVAEVHLGDSRSPEVWRGRRLRWIITSPPYYGMRTYIPDQWLRNWFVGGPATVQYDRPSHELGHASPETFANNLRKVWRGLADHAAGDARLVIRFGGINDRDVDTVDLLKLSLAESGWRLQTLVDAGDADTGRRQARQFLKKRPCPKAEHDFHAELA
jgi:DNA methylase